MSPQDLTRLQRDSGAIRQGRNQLNASLLALRDAMTRFVHNEHVRMLMTVAGTVEAEIAAGVYGAYISDVWVEATAPGKLGPGAPLSRFPTHVFTVKSDVQLVEDGEPVFTTGTDLTVDADGLHPGQDGYVETFVQTPVMGEREITLTYCPAKRFLFRNTAQTLGGAASMGGSQTEIAYLYPGNDASTTEEHIGLMHAAFSFGVLTGSVDSADVEALFGRAPADVEEIYTLLDYCPG